MVYVEHSKEDIGSINLEHKKMYLNKQYKGLI